MILALEIHNIHFRIEPQKVWINSHFVRIDIIPERPTFTNHNLEVDLVEFPVVEGAVVEIGGKKYTTINIYTSHGFNLRFLSGESHIREANIICGICEICGTYFPADLANTAD